jgi:hypothetical protein
MTRELKGFRHVAVAVAEIRVSGIIRLGLSPPRPSRKRRILNAQRRKTSADSVILQRRRRTEDRHDPVAGELVHGAAIPLHQRRAPVGKVSHDLSQSLGTNGGGDFHPVDHVGKQNRYLLVLRIGTGVVDR